MSDHIFFEIDRVSRPDTAAGAQVTHRQVFGVKVGCAGCGEIRHVWPDGKVQVVVPASKETLPHACPASTIYPAG